MNTKRNKKLVDSFVTGMEECIRFYSNGKISDKDIKYLSEYEVNRLDFENQWQMHKGLGYFARGAVERFLANEARLKKNI